MYGKIVGLGPVVQGEKSRKSGKPFMGQTAYLTVKKRGVEGQAVKEQYINMLGMEKPPILKIGQDLFLDFDESGFLLDVEVLAPEK